MEWQSSLRACFLNDYEGGRLAELDSKEQFAVTARVKTAVCRGGHTGRIGGGHKLAGIFGSFSPVTDDRDLSAGGYALVWAAGLGLMSAFAGLTVGSPDLQADSAEEPRTPSLLLIRSSGCRCRSLTDPVLSRFWRAQVGRSSGWFHIKRLPMLSPSGPPELFWRPAARVIVWPTKWRERMHS